MEIIIKTHNGYKMRRKDRKWSTLTPGKRMGFSRLLPSILLVSVVCGANIVSKELPGTLKPFLRTLKSVFSTFWNEVKIVSCEDVKAGEYYTLNTTIWKSKSWSRFSMGA